MEEILTKVAEYSSVSGIAIAITYLYLKYGKKNGITKLDNKQAIDIAVLKEKVLEYERNHFPTIERRFDKNDASHEQIFKTQQEIIKTLAKIEAKIV